VFVAEADAAPWELSAIANVMPSPPLPFVPEERRGQLVIVALMCYAGEVEDGEKALAPFRVLAEPVVDMLRTMPYREIYPPEEAGLHPTAVLRTMFVDAIDPAAAGTIVERLEASTHRCRLRRSGCWAGRWLGCPTTPRRSPTATDGSW